MDALYMLVYDLQKNLDNNQIKIQEDVIVRIARQTTECCYFIRSYASDPGFGTYNYFPRYLPLILVLPSSQTHGEEHNLQRGSAYPKLLQYLWRASPSILWQDPGRDSYSSNPRTKWGPWYKYVFLSIYK